METLSRSICSDAQKVKQRNLLNSILKLNNLFLFVCDFGSFENWKIVIYVYWCVCGWQFVKYAENSFLDKLFCDQFSSLSKRHGMIFIQLLKSCSFAFQSGNIMNEFSQAWASWNSLMPYISSNLNLFFWLYRISIPSDQIKVKIGKHTKKRLKFCQLTLII